MRAGAWRFVGLVLIGVCSRSFAQDVPKDSLSTVGKAGAGLEAFDGIMARVLEKHSVPGATLAIAKDGKLVLAKGYGLADISDNAPMRPETTFVLASVSKSITAATVLKLVEQGKLTLDEPAFARLAELMPPGGRGMDPRLRKITVRMLLNHSGGWDRKISGDPSGFGRRVARALRVRGAVTADDLIRFMMREPLDFDPGTRAAYSNFGYVVLGAIIERVTGERFGEAVHRITLRPMGIGRVRIDPPGREYLAGEAHRYSPETDHPLPGGHPVMTAAAGGWEASAVEMARFLTAMDGSRGEAFLSEAMMKQMLAAPPAPQKPRRNGSYFGLGWDTVRPGAKGFEYGKNGGLPGICTYIEHMPGGVDWVVLFNSRQAKESGETPLLGDTQKAVRRAIEEVKQWPSVDLFSEYR